MAINYAEQFLADLEQKYSRELVSGDFTMQGAKFVDAKTIKIPRLRSAGTKNIRGLAGTTGRRFPTIGRSKHYPMTEM